jgi:hypothetical protein
VAATLTVAKREERRRWLDRSGQRGDADRGASRVAGGQERRGGGESLGHVLDPDRKRDRDPEVRPAGSERNPHRHSLGNVVDGERREEQHGAPAGCDVCVASLDEA